MSKKWFLLLLLVHISLLNHAQKDSLERLYQEAERLIAQKIKKNTQQQAHILKQIETIGEETDLNKKFQLEITTARAYRSFIQDSAIRFAIRANNSAFQLRETKKLNESRLEISWILILKGFFKEAIDTLNNISPQYLSSLKRIDFYTAMYRVHYDLATSRHRHFKEHYKQTGDLYCQKIWNEASSKSYAYQLSKALNHLARSRHTKSIATYAKMLSELKLDKHQKAVCHFGLGIQYGFIGDSKLKEYHLLKSTIFDLQANIKETAASYTLAEYLYQTGNIEQAYLFIRNAKEDADFYDSHARKLAISKVMPKIELARFQKIKSEKTLANIINAIVIGVCLIIVYLSFLFYRQVKILNVARREILITNQDLAQRNLQLKEANKIKEDYIGYYFNFSTQYIDRLENLKKSLLQKATVNRFQDIDNELKRIDPQHERQLLFEHFDQIFLEVFPNFVECFNLLFHPDQQTQQKSMNTLNTDLRIYALIRLGIINNEKIANILGFSVNTIYTYKTKIKKRSFVANEEFEKRIMEIPSVG